MICISTNDIDRVGEANSKMDGYVVVLAGPFGGRHTVKQQAEELTYTILLDRADNVTHHHTSEVGHAGSQHNELYWDCHC